MRVDVFTVKTHFRNEGKLFQNAVEPALPGHQRCPLGGDAPQARRGGSVKPERVYVAPPSAR